MKYWFTSLIGIEIVWEFLFSSFSSEEQHGNWTLVTLSVSAIIPFTGIITNAAVITNTANKNRLRDLFSKFNSITIFGVLIFKLIYT